MRPHKVLLTVSIVLNVLFAGVILGDMVPRLVTSPFSLGSTPQLIAKLPDSRRALFMDTMTPALQQVEEAHRRIMDAKNEALRLLKADHFSAQAYLAQTQRMNDLHAQMKLHMAETISSLASQFSHEERLILADIISSLPPSSAPSQASALNNGACDKPKR